MNPRKKLPFLIILALALVCGDSREKIYLFKGGVKTRPEQGLSREELGFYPPQGKFFSQSWTFIYYLEDGSGGYIQLSHLRLGYLLQQLLVHHSHYTEQGQLIYQKKIVPAKDWEWEQAKPRLRIGPAYWEGFYPDFYLFAPLKGITAKLKFHCLTPGWRPGEGPTYYGSPQGEWYDLVVMIPWAEVSGTIKIPGREKSVRGFGYADHNIQTIWFTTQCQELYALRSFARGWAIHFLDYHSPARFNYQRMSWLLVMKEGRIIYATDQYQIYPSEWSEEPERKRKYPKKARIVVDQPELKLTGEIQGRELLEVLDVRDQLPGWAVPLAEKLIRQPAFIRQRAHLFWKITHHNQSQPPPRQRYF